MKQNDIIQYLGEYGLLTWSTLKKNRSAERKAYHGVIKHVDEDVILFRITGMATRTIKLENIMSFEPMEMGNLNR
jgi:hypothetical protein